MSKKNNYLLGIVLTIILGIFLYHKFCCNCQADKPKVEKETIIPSVPIDTVAVKPSTTDWITIKEKINANPLVLYFNTAESNNELTNEEKQKMTDLADYIKNVPDATILAVGHTDNVGSRDSNMNLGKSRAEFAKNYLAGKGIDAGKISIDSKGPDDPISDNGTDEGRAKNRRTVITIK